MTNAVLDIRLLVPAEWRVLRDIRLRALSDSPQAFCSRYRWEWRWSEQQWRERFDGATWVVAVERGDVIGLAGLVGGHPEEPEHVESIWVAPTHRNRGVFRSLLDTVVDTARRTGLSALLLWVLEDNAVAQRAYSRLGFTWTGERQRVGSGRRHRYERRMRLNVPAVTGPAPIS